MDAMKEHLFALPAWSLLCSPSLALSREVLMCLQPGEEIGKEVHPDVDQFFRIEQGEARYVLSEKEEHLVRGGDGVVVPAGTYHNVLNTSKTRLLQLYWRAKATASAVRHRKTKRMQ